MLITPHTIANHVFYYMPLQGLPGLSPIDSAMAQIGSTFF